ncbi:hypothetical protein LINPERPRIM_LOCUS30218, partial [Linum perenne]
MIPSIPPTTKAVDADGICLFSLFLTTFPLVGGEPPSKSGGTTSSSPQLSSKASPLTVSLLILCTVSSSATNEVVMLTNGNMVTFDAWLNMAI